MEMIAEKPGWIRHEGMQIFSVDIQPGGLRFATGGGDHKVCTFAFLCFQVRHFLDSVVSSGDAVFWCCEPGMVCARVSATLLTCVWFVPSPGCSSLQGFVLLMFANYTVGAVGAKVRSFTVSRECENWLSELGLQCSVSVCRLNLHCV